MDNKKLKIIRYLMDRERFVTGRELAEYLSVSVKTVTRYIKDINYFLQAYGTEIQSSKGLGYRAHERPQVIYNLRTLFFISLSPKKLLPLNRQSFWLSSAHKGHFL